MTRSTAPNPFAPPQAEVADVGTGADTTFELKLFSPAGRIGRIRFLAYSFGLSFLIAIVAGVLATVTTPMLAALGYVAMIYVHVMLAIKRSHDFNVTGWLALLTLVPVANLVFLFIPGTDGPNRFGNKTAPNGRSAAVVIAVLVGVILIGILAAIAIPAYQDYTVRARAAKASAATPSPLGAKP